MHNAMLCGGPPATIDKALHFRSVRSSYKLEHIVRSRWWHLLVLRQAVGNVIPRSLRSNEAMAYRFYSWIRIERAQSKAVHLLVALNLRDEI